MNAPIAYARWEVILPPGYEAEGIGGGATEVERWTDRDLRGLRAFADRSPDCVAGILATTGTRMAALGERLWAVPLSLLLS